MVDFVHERQQHAEFAGGETFAREPAEIVSRQIGNLAPLVFPIRHFPRQQEGEFF